MQISPSSLMQDPLYRSKLPRMQLPVSPVPALPRPTFLFHPLPLTSPLSHPLPISLLFAQKCHQFKKHTQPELRLNTVVGV